MCGFILTKTVPVTLLILRRATRYIIIHAHRSSHSVRYYYQILIKLEFSRQIFQNTLIIIS